MKMKKKQIRRTVSCSGLVPYKTEEVSKELKKMQDKGEKRKKYCVWTPQQRLEIGEHTEKNGNASTL